MHRSVTIFRLDRRAKPDPLSLTLAQNALRRMKVLRHPYILRYVDGGETDGVVVLVGEGGTPLGAWLAGARPSKGAPSSPDFDAACVWGVYSLLTALNFLAGCDLLHANVSTDSILVTKGGEWRLGGLELSVEASTGRGWLAANDASGPCPAAFKAPERADRDWGSVEGGPRTALDAFSLGMVLAEVWGLVDPTSPGEVSAAQEGRLSRAAAGDARLPPQLAPFVARLLSRSPTSRPTFAEVLACPYFKHPLVGTLLFLDELALKEPAEKARFFKALPTLLPRFPDGMCKYRCVCGGGWGGVIPAVCVCAPLAHLRFPPPQDPSRAHERPRVWGGGWRRHRRAVPHPRHWGAAAHFGVPARHCSLSAAPVCVH